MAWHGRHSAESPRRTGDTRTTNTAPYTHKHIFYIVRDIPPRPLANCIESDKHAESPRRTGSIRTNTAPYTHKHVFTLSKISHLGPWQIVLSLTSIPKAPVGQAVYVLTQLRTPINIYFTLSEMSHLGPWQIVLSLTSMPKAPVG